MKDVMTLRSCPFCGGDAIVRLYMIGPRSGTMTIHVEHDEKCMISDKSEVTWGHICFDAGTDCGKVAIESIAKSAAKIWNRRTSND